MRRSAIFFAAGDRLCREQGTELFPSVRGARPRARLRLCRHDVIDRHRFEAAWCQHVSGLARDCRQRAFESSTCLCLQSRLKSCNGRDVRYAPRRPEMVELSEVPSNPELGYDASKRR